MRFATALVVALVATAPVASARQQATLTPTLDTSLYQESGTVSNGKGSHLFAGRTANGAAPARRALLAFDLSGVPAGATITGAALTLNMNRTVAGPFAVRLHRVTASWGEGTSDAGSQEGTGAAATAGDATWTQRVVPGTGWANPGGDFEPSASATVSVGGNGKYTWSGPGLVADVQAWVNGTAPNHGWILVGDESGSTTAKRFDSRESPSPANRPALVVSWSVGTSVEAAVLPIEPVLAQNWPNPFRESTTFSFAVPRGSRLELAVFDLLGRTVAVPASGWHEAGRYEVALDGSAWVPGLYMARLRVGERVLTRQLVRLP